MKRAIVLVSPEFIGQFCKPLKKTAITIHGSVPNDAKFITANFSNSSQCFEVFFEHDSFEDIPEGVLLPILNSPAIEKHLEDI